MMYANTGTFDPAALLLSSLPALKDIILPHIIPNQSAPYPSEIQQSPYRTDEGNTHGSIYSRSAGILLHVTSLPGPHGIGDLGPPARAFVTSLAEAKQTWWQILPLGPPGAGDSPYQCFSAMAGNWNLISPDDLISEQLLAKSDIRQSQLPAGTVNFSKVTRSKMLLLERAWQNFQAGVAPKLRNDFEQFLLKEKAWLDDFALFMAIKEKQGTATWTQWPREIAMRKPSALHEARRELADSVESQQFAQFLFFRQLGALRDHARSLAVKLVGDLPIFVSGESSDVWAYPHLFQLDRDRKPKFVAGVPPDYFCETGQRWGNPLYNWNAMQKDGFRWWIERAKMALRQADLVRIDHFRGFEACWTIPSSEPTAQNGKWVKAPGVEFFETLRQEFGSLPFIAEDLGVITPEVESLRDSFGLPGMRVLQFGFGPDAKNPFLPHNYIRNAIAYTGTHDNDTTAGWYRSLDRTTRKHVAQYAPEAASDPAGALMRLAWSSVADVAIAPLQDLLKLGREARINTPGSASGNWRWRMRSEMLTSEHLSDLRQLTETYGRSSETMVLRRRA